MKEENKDRLNDFLLKFTKDDKPFKAGSEENQIAFIAGFIRGVKWALKQSENDNSDIKNKFYLLAQEKTSSSD